jgi:hypothetical protein
MKLFTGWVLAAGLVLAGTTAQAQVASPYSRVSDFGGPYSEAPNYREDAYRGGPYYAPPPQEAPAPPRYGYGYGPAPAPALMPVHEVYNIIREAGFSPLGIPRQRGYVYTIAVIDRGGEDGRLVIDGRSGQIIRFTPAWRMSQFGGAYNAVRGEPGPMLPQAVHVAGAPRPPASVPRVASRTVPVPKPSPLTANAAPEQAKPAAQTAAKPAAEPSSQQAAMPAAEPPSQQATVAQAKPADTAPAAAATAGQVQAKPAAPSILPTQDMPKAQGLD